jgi:uroporphyrinogen-III synthase
MSAEHSLSLQTESLKGIHVLVTRPIDQAEPWIKYLQSLGAETTHIPAIGILPIDNKAETENLKQKILDLDKYQKLIFVSQNAVTHGVEWIDRYWPQLPSDQDFFAIGAATARLLKEKLSHYELPVASSAEETAMNSEALLDLPAMQKVKGQQILLFRGQGGRTLLSEVLEARGAKVDYCELYKRILPITFNFAAFDHFKNTTKQPVTSVHSGESLNNLCQLISTIKDKKHLPWLKEQALLVPGERVAEQAKTLGFNEIIVAKNATQKSMTGALNDWRQKNG